MPLLPPFLFFLSPLPSESDEPEDSARSLSSDNSPASAVYDFTAFSTFVTSFRSAGDKETARELLTARGSAFRNRRDAMFADTVPFVEPCSCHFRLKREITSATVLTSFFFFIVFTFSGKVWMKLSATGVRFSALSSLASPSSAQNFTILFVSFSTSVPVTGYFAAVSEVESIFVVKILSFTAPDRACPATITKVILVSSYTTYGRARTAFLTAFRRDSTDGL
mmetsp:Transcript_49532/g.97510  ORF Transcript_49532/g.97510 Transcript_49532/m.97510 type:complete len:223 (-) Transcript_49532:142-810(-)